MATIRPNTSQPRIVPEKFHGERPVDLVGSHRVSSRGKLQRLYPATRS